MMTFLINIFFVASFLPIGITFFHMQLRNHKVALISSLKEIFLIIDWFKNMKMMLNLWEFIKELKNLDSMV